MGTLDLERPTPSTGQKYDELLSMPGDMMCAEAAAIPRATCEYTPRGQGFLLGKQRSFDRQYAQLYFSRLLKLRQVVQQQVQAAWPGTPVVKILSVGEDQEVAVIGTLYKDMKLKPSILDEYAKQPGFKQALGGTGFCSDDDSLVLEDEGARMSMRSECAELQPDSVVTGVVLAVRGRAEPGGDFVVSGVLWAGLPEQPQRPLPQEDAYVALVSGLQLANSKADMMQVQLLVDFLTGNLGAAPQQQLAAKVVQLVIAGGSLGQLEALAAANPYSRQQTTDMEPVRDMDLVMTELAAALPVDIMPGPDDPANVSLPQQPLHQCLFPGAAPYSSFRRVTNPHAFELGGCLLLGTAGQNIDDMAKYTRGRSRLDLLACCLQWRHLCPTAPDTLTCFPFGADDPFVLQQCPHIMFAANQPEFDTRLLEGPGGASVRLVCVPSFIKTGTLVLVNLRTLQCQPLTFQSNYTSS